MQSDAAKEKPDMTRMYLVAAAALTTFSVLACSRSSENNKANETNTTSASQPVEQPSTPAPSTLDTSGAPADVSPNADLAAKDGGHGNVNAKDGGHLSAPSGMSTGTMRNTGDTDQVAPGHITTPPGRARGTGQPNSNGSHDMGSGAGTK
jgi:hypothetical protein